MTPRPPGGRRTPRDLITLLVVALMLASAPGSAPRAVAQDVPEETPLDPAATEATAEPLAEPVTEVAPVESEPPVEEAWPVEPTVEPQPPEEAAPADEALLPEVEAPVEEPPEDDPTATATAEAPTETAEPPVVQESPEDDPAAGAPTVTEGASTTPEPTPSPTTRVKRSSARAEIGAAAGSTLTMTLALSPTGSPVAGTAVTGQVTWSSIPGGIPTGTVQYRVFTGSSCTGALFSEAGTKTMVGTPTPNGSVPPSDAVVMAVAGAHSWRAIYSGDANYLAGSVCVNQTVGKRTPTLVLAVSPSPGVAGDAFVGTATLSNATSTASGNLTYSLHTSSSCTTTLAATGIPNVKAVAGGVAPPSDAITINSASTAYWKAAYAGDANNNAVSSTCVAVTMVKRSPTLSLAVTSTSGAAGQGAYAQATLTNATSNASGTVTYGIYTNSTCSTTLSLTGNTHTKAAVSGVVPVGNTLTIPVVTTYWKASIAADSFNNAASSPCVLLSLAKASPTITLTTAAVVAPMKAGQTARGTATLASTGPSAATTGAAGTAGYTVYKDNACSVVLVATNNKTFTGRAIPVSSNLTIDQAGLVYWRATWAGDANNNAAASDCVGLAVAKSDPAFTMSFTYGTTPMKAGSTAKVRAYFVTSPAVTASATAGGTILYTVFTDSACTSSFALTGNPHTKTVAARAASTSNSFTFPTAATYYWRADYSGDANNNAASSPCTAMVVAKSTPTLTLTIYPTTAPMRAGGSAKAYFTMAGSNATAGGSATYAVYSDGTCTTTMTITGSPSTVTVVNKTPSYSALITFPAIGTVYWRATYTGDVNNGGATSACVALVVGSSTPTLTVATSPAGSVLVDDAAVGNATLTGSTTTAGGTATYTVYTDSACTSQLAAAGNPSSVTVVNRVVPSSAPITLSQVGTLYWRVTYGGDVDNGAAASGCLALIVNRRSPTLSLTITYPVSPMQAGEDATGHAALNGATASGSGSVVYAVYANNVCTVSVAPPKTSTQIVSGNVVDASDAFTFNSLGTFYWRAQYGGDGSNNPATSPCVALNVVDEAVASLDLTVLPNPIAAGATAEGGATLSGVTATAGGAVVYTVYADEACTVAVSPPRTSTKTVVNGVVPTSDAFAFQQAGTFYWTAVYGGDPSNDGDASACVGLTVEKASPALGLTVAPNPAAAASGSVGAAGLTGATAAAAGSATYTVYANNTCTTQVSPAKTSAVTVAGAVVPASASLVIQSAGTVYWRVVYAGDANNQAVTSACLAVIVAKATPTLALSVAPGTIAVWGTAAGSASVAGGTTAVTGSVVYTVYADDGCAVAATPAKASTKTVAAGTVAPASFAFDLAGTVYWQAAYGGDANNAVAESACVPLTVEGGPLLASVSSVTMAPVGYSASQQTNTGTMVLTVVDRRGTQDGWSVTLSVSDFAYTGVSPTAQPIPAGAYSIQSAGSPVYVRGQAIDGASGPFAPGGATGPLDEPMVVLVADEGYGAGEYTQAYTVVLVIPAGSKAGAYTAVVTTTTSAAP